MFEWVAIAAVVIVISVAILAYFDLADVLVDLFASLAQLVVATVTLTIALIALLLNALRRLVRKQNTGIHP